MGGSVSTSHTHCIMETLTSSLLFFIFLLLLFKLLGSKAQSPNSRLPPGPRKLPIIGSLHHLLGSLPHRALRDLAATHGPFMHLRLGQVDTVVVSSSEMAKEIMKTHDVVFADRPSLVAVQIMSYDAKDIAWAKYSDYWRQLRKICILELLSNKRVQSFRSIREEEVFNMIKFIYTTVGSPVNLSKTLPELANDMTTRAAVGSKCRERKAFLAAMTETIKASSGFNLADLYPSSRLVDLASGMASKMKKLHKSVDVILDRIIEEHKERKAFAEGERVEDLLDVLLRLQAEGGLEFELGDDNIKAIVTEMFGAGSETSSTTIEWAMSELMRNPEAMKKAQAEAREVFKGRTQVLEESINELHYLKMVIKETLRLHPPVPLLVPRECTKTCEVTRYLVPEKTRVLVNAWAIGRDPQVWSKAEEFQPERFEGSEVDFKGTSFEFVPFGAGRRVCPGIAFGMANVELPLANLLYFFDWKLPREAEAEGLDMREGFGITTRRKTDLCLYAIPRIPCTLEQKI